MENNSQIICPPKKSTKYSRSQSVFILVFSAFAMVLAALIITQDMSKVKDFISQAGAWGIVICIIIYAVLGITVIPSEPLTFFIGVLFGPWMATLVAGFGNTLSAFVEYYLGTHIGSATNFVQRKDKLPFGLSRLKVDAPIFLITARMIPGYGAKFVSLLAGIYRVPLLRYFWTTAIPIFAGAAIVAFGGSEILILTNIK